MIKVTFTNKDDASGTAALRIVTDDDINELKTVINTNADATVLTAASGSPLSPNADTAHDLAQRTLLVVNLTIDNPTGTPREGQSMAIRILGDATPRTLTWGNKYKAMSGLALPTITVASKWRTNFFMYNLTIDKWEHTGQIDEA